MHRISSDQYNFSLPLCSTITKTHTLQNSMPTAAKITTARLEPRSALPDRHGRHFPDLADKRSIEDFQYAAERLEYVKAWLEPSYNDPTTLQWVIRKQGCVLVSLRSVSKRGSTLCEYNTASYRILEKAGFIREKVVTGNWKWHDQVYDSAYYYLCKPGTGG